MKNIVKSTAAVLAAAMMVGVNVAPSVIAWGDNSGLANGRPSYKNNDITLDTFGNTPVFNSISDNPNFGDEKNFVGARLDDGDHGINNKWNANDITVKDGQTYIIRLYVHNNNPKGTDAIAKDVTTTFALPTTTGKDLQVNGFIDSSNAVPSSYWDYVNFHSDNGQAFYLDYIEGSALLENNGVAAHPGIKLSDNIITKSGVKIGYEALNGEVPGCYQYAQYVTIKVKAVYTDAPYLVEKSVRKVGDKEWSNWVEAKVGEEVEYQILYKNTTSETAYDVMVKDILPENMEYVSGSTKVYDALFPKGANREDGITDKGINLGNFTSNSNAYIRFRAKVVDRSMVCGVNQLVNWGQIGVGSTTLQDSASVAVKKDCANTPKELPSTGAGSIVSGVIGATAVVTAAGYFIASRKQLR